MHDMTDSRAAARRWFSPRGARRGAWLAALAALFWLAWCAGYAEGSSCAAQALRQGGLVLRQGKAYGAFAPGADCSSQQEGTGRMQAPTDRLREAREQAMDMVHGGATYDLQPCVVDS